MHVWSLVSTCKWVRVLVWTPYCREGNDHSFAIPTQGNKYLNCRWVQLGAEYVCVCVCVCLFLSLSLSFSFSLLPNPGLNIPSKTVFFYVQSNARSQFSTSPDLTVTFCSVNYDIQSERWVLISVDKWTLGWWGIWERLGKKEYSHYRRCRTQ